MEHSSSSATPCVEVVSGLARQRNFVPSKRFRKECRETLKLATVGGGAQNKHSWRSRRVETNKSW